jgi:hypothetical protein
MPDLDELTDAERRIAVVFAVSGAALITLFAVTGVLLFVLGVPDWVWAPVFVLFGLVAGLGTYLFLRRVGVSRRRAALWGVLAGSPLADLLWFVKDSERSKPNEAEQK